MPSEALSCPICYCEYDSTDNIPRVIPLCGHTVCTTCLSRIIQTPATAKCPMDNKPLNYEHVHINMFPINFIVKQLCNDKPAKQVCQQHNQKLRLVCMTDNCYVCEECVFQGDHKSHDINSRKKFDEDCEAKKKGLQAHLKELNNYNEDIERMFEEKRQSLLLYVKERFQELKWLLMKKEIDMCLEVNSLFEVEKNGREHDTEFTSEYISEIMKATKELREAIDGGDNFKLMNLDPNSIMTIDSESFQNQLHDLHAKLNNLTVNFHESLNTQMSTLKSVKSPMEDIMGHISLDHVLEYNPGTVLKSGNLMAAGLVNNHLEIEVQDDTLVITISANSGRKQDLKAFVADLDVWNKLDKAHIKIMRGDCLEDGVQALAYLWPNLHEMSTLKIESKALNLNDYDLVKLFAVVCQNISSLHDFYLDLSDNRVGDLALEPLFQEVLPRVSRLRSLTLNLNATLITDNSLKAMGTNLHSILRRLEVFDLRLWEAKITDRGILDMFTKMDRVKKFVLDLGCTGVTNECIKAFAIHTLPSMKVVEEFKLGLAQTNVCDQGVTQLFAPMQSVRNFFLFLHGTKITDSSVEALARKTLPAFTKLEVLEMRIGNTKVSDYGATQLFNNLHNVKKFVLKMQSTSVTDRTAEAFAKVGLPSMKALSEFEFDVTRTEVSEKWISHLGRMRERMGAVV